MSSVHSATSAAHRVPSHSGPSPRAALGHPSTLGAAVPDSQHCHRPEGTPAHTPHSNRREDSPRVFIAPLPLLCHRARRMIAESGAPARARPTRPRWREFLTLVLCEGVAEKHRYFNSLPEPDRWRRGRQSPYAADMRDEMTRAATTDTDP